MNDTLFKNTTKYDKESLLKLQNKVILKWIILGASIIILISLAVGVPLILFVNEFVGGAIIVLGALGGAVLLPYLLKDSVKKQNAKVLGDRKYLNTFEFYEDKMIIINSATKSLDDNDYTEIARAEIEISNIYRLLLDNIYIFIYLDKKQSLFLDQRGMTKGTAGELAEFLQNKGVKVIKKNNK